MHPCGYFIFWLPWYLDTLNFLSFYFSRKIEYDYYIPTYITKKSKTLEAQALLTVTGCMKSTPTIALSSECGEMYFHRRKIQLTAKFVLKSIGIEKNPITGYLLNQQYTLGRPPALIGAVDLVISKHDKIAKYEWLICYTFPYKLYTIGVLFFASKMIKSSNNSDNLKQIRNEQFSDYPRLHTDGSVNPSDRSCGIGVTISKSNIFWTRILADETSIRTAEVAAIWKIYTVNVDPKPHEDTW